MPLLPKPGGVLSRLALVNQLIGIVRETRIDEVRRDAEMRPVMLTVAPTREQAADLGQRLTGWAEDRAVATATFTDPLGDLNRFDVIVAWDPDDPGRVNDLRRRAERIGTMAALVRHDATSLDDDRAINSTRERIIDVLPERAVAFGRAFPPFRDIAVRKLIRTTARSNAQFALIANIPTIVPIVGSLLSAGADMLILTKNQVMLLFKIAAIHGRDLRDTAGILRELIPVVGSGLLWRTLAREAVGFLPLMAGTIPKVGIAYAGTFAVGHGADYYYKYGHGPTRAQRQEFYRHASEQMASHDADLLGKPEKTRNGSDVAALDTAASAPSTSGGRRDGASETAASSDSSGGTVTGADSGSGAATDHATADRAPQASTATPGERTSSAGPNPS